MTKKVLVVGGGIGGQSVAIALQKKGYTTEIVELQKEFNVYGVGIIQQANALRALDAIGVADETIRCGYPYGKVKLCIPTGQQIGEAGTPPIGRFPSHNGISRRMLHDVLYTEAQRTGVIYRMGLTVDAIDNRTDGVEVTFTDGTTGSYDFLIAADGINSKVRTMVFGEQKPDYVGLSVWRYAFPRPQALDTGYIYFGRQSKIGIIPMTAETCYIFVNSAEGPDPHVPADQLTDKLRGYMKAFPVPMIQALAEQVTDAALVNYRPLETLKLSAPWYKNRVIVIGDAAHATIPQLGSGAALAIEDAVVLAEELQTAPTIEGAFAGFMARRLQRCQMVVEASETLGKWEVLEYSGQPLPEGANMGALMGKTTMALTAPI